MRHLIAASVIWALCNSASAGVVYQWKTLETSPTISSAAGRIEITEDAWAAGGASYSAPPNCQLNEPDCDYSDRGSPVLKFSFRANAPAPTGADIDFDLFNGTGVHIPVSDWFIADFTIAGRILALTAYADTGATSLYMDNNQVAWFASDFPDFGTECMEQHCEGATGQWVQVPEPGTAGLLGIGLVSALLMRARRKRAA